MYGSVVPASVGLIGEFGTIKAHRFIRKIGTSGRKRAVIISVPAAGAVEAPYESGDNPRLPFETRLSQGTSTQRVAPDAIKTTL